MKFLLAGLFLALTLTAASQRQYFVLIESENSQPFYVRIGDNNYSSSSFGHVILSSLSDSAYTMEIGFPKDQFPSNQFVIRIKKKDHGYQLKNLPDKGWVLFDYQTMELIYPIKKQDGLSQTGYSMVKRNDGFAKLLSQVVNDTAVLYTLVSEKPVEPLIIPPAKSPVDSMVVKKEEKPKPEAAKVNENPLAIPAVLKLAEKETDSGRELTYKDNNDSVRIFISSETVQEKEPQPKENSNSSAINAAIVAPVIPDNSKSSNTSTQTNSKEKPATDVIEKKSDDGTSFKSKDTPTPPIVTKDSSTEQKKVVLINSDCKAIAWDNDVDKLRIKMAAEKDIDGKINAARKIFKAKCFTSAQIKALTELFVTDEEKYKFLDTAYPFVTDWDNFKQLSYLLSDPYYVKRFRTMVRLD